MMGMMSRQNTLKMSAQCQGKAYRQKEGQREDHARGREADLVLTAKTTLRKKAASSLDSKRKSKWVKTACLRRQGWGAGYYRNCENAPSLATGARVCQWLRDGRNRGGGICTEVLADSTSRTERTSEPEGPSSVAAGTLPEAFYTRSKVY